MKKVLCILLALIFCISPVLAQDHSVATGTTDQEKLDEFNTGLKTFGKSLGLGLAASGAAIGIGILASRTIEGIARQPEMREELLSSMRPGILACSAMVFGTAVSFAFF